VGWVGEFDSSPLGCAAVAVELTHALNKLPSGEDVLVVRITGSIASGTDGNDPTAALDERVNGLFERLSPAAVVLDLLDLEYLWGDGMIKVAYPADHVPVAVAARGETAKALGSLLPLSYPDLPILPSMDQSLDWVDATLGILRRGD
jgi:hypothetical protein